MQLLEYPEVTYSDHLFLTGIIAIMLPEQNKLTYIYKASDIEFPLRHVIFMECFKKKF